MQRERYEVRGEVIERHAVIGEEREISSKRGRKREKKRESERK